MGFESYISESEAATLANVGALTLRRFAEAGYFKIETEADGLRLYARSDLERVFGLKPKPAQPPPRAVQPAPSIPATPILTVPQKFTLDPSIVAAPAVAESVNTEAANADVPQEPIVEAKPAAAATPPKPAPEVHVQQAPAEAAPTSNPAIEMLDRDLQRERTINEMHARLLAIREDEIQGLKEERDWLRARIEKLEEKASRDQVLLLSETQTIKALITIQEQRRSPVRLALEWLGFVAPPPIESPTRSAIEIQSHNGFESKKAA